MLHSAELEPSGNKSLIWRSHHKKSLPYKIEVNIDHKIVELLDVNFYASDAAHGLHNYTAAYNSSPHKAVETRFSVTFNQNSSDDLLTVMKFIPINLQTLYTGKRIKIDLWEAKEVKR